MTNAIHSDDPNAAEQITAKIAKLEALQTIMKAANAIIRKKLTDDEKVAELVKIEHISEARARELLKPDFMGRLGFPAYEITNNGANIRRLQQRLPKLATEEATPTAEIPFAGGRIVDNAEMSRVQIFFDSRPPRQMCENLRASGFKWAPSISAWQRLRNETARWAAGRVLGIKWPMEAAAQHEAQ
jgi:hypothetical protein